MAEIGKYNKLTILRTGDLGIYLDAEDDGELLLPRDQVPSDCHEGKIIEVFLYGDSEGRIIPTTKQPYASVGKFSCLKVIDVMDMGAFLDWGLPKDLFVPSSEQQQPMEEGEFYIVYVYKDDMRNRVAASSRLDTFLGKEPIDFHEQDKVDLLICRQTDLGYNAIINDSHGGLLFQDQVFQPLEYGQRVKGFINKIREDGKIDLSLNLQGYQKMDALESEILAQLNKSNGMLNLTDKSSPQSIYALFGVSKKIYKMALGSLYKAQRISLESDHVKLK